jgi:hypothetical protein
MTKCDSIDSDILLKQFKELNTKTMITFFSWTDYISCTAEQKTTIINKINVWRNNYRSISVSGFCDNDNNVPMIYNEEEYPNNILTSTSVTDYLQNFIKNSNNENLFHYVFPPQYGIREVIVKLQNYSQAVSFIKVIQGELERTMDNEAIKLVFEDHGKASRDSTKYPWKPSANVYNIYYQHINQIPQDLIQNVNGSMKIMKVQQ